MYSILIEIINVILLITTLTTIVFLTKNNCYICPDDYDLKEETNDTVIDTFVDPENISNFDVNCPNYYYNLIILYVCFGLILFSSITIIVRIIINNNIKSAKISPNN